jgi:hypothetical protein
MQSRFRAQNQESKGRKMTESDTFNYIEALQLVIIAIGVTKIAEGLGSLIHNRRKPYEEQ